jgi:protein-L-isoaspartate(D-aspartate) O-methyltransferase
MGDRPRALLVWPGGLFGSAANFGVPQLLAIAAAMKAGADVDVDVVDLDAEAALGTKSLRDVLARGGRYDLVGISCYSSYDYLKVLALGDVVREALPRAWLVTGGYHASARPDDFTTPESPFDFVVVGDGETPMARLASALSSGKRPLLRVLGPEAVAHPGAMPPVDWELLSRYRSTARSAASQAEIYLSRGCPYDCAFCMERAKRDTSWRALDPAQALDEMHRLDAFLDLSGWTLFIADALFGMKTPWRRAFLEGLARRPVRARKVWLLVRLDLLEREDIELMARANVAPGFGLESGDPDQVRRIRKVGRLSDYLDQMVRVAEWARELDVPWGANVIVGHPGETEASLRTSARYLAQLYERGTTGFLSVDPFRLYPGSPIDEERDKWEADTGMRVHRYPWWHDGDQEFLSEWVDPSRELTFRRAHALRHELFLPILESVRRRFSYGGPARDYFERAIAEQLLFMRPSAAARTLAMEQMWSALTAGRAAVDVRDDAELAAFSVAARREVLASSGVALDVDATSRALCDVPRERFVSLESLPLAHLDRALPLDESGRATISAMHAYNMQMRALGLADGDHVVDLGGGTGYGAALAASVVGERGSVTTIEIDPELSGRARDVLSDLPQVTALCADAHSVDAWRGATKVMVGFDVGVIPDAWLEALAPGGRLVAPASRRLVLVEKGADGAITRRSLGEVLFVGDRSEAAEVEPGEPGGVRRGEARATGA